MLPKPEKKSFKNSPEQLDLVETVNEGDKLKKKRLYIIIVILLTVGLSFSFWFYRQIQTVDFNNLSLPNLSLKLPHLSQTKFTPSIPDSWSLSIESLSAPPFYYSSKFNPETNFSQITTVNFPPFAKKYLPDGVSVTEKINSASDYMEIYSSVSSPKINFNIYVKINGPQQDSLSQIDQYAKIVETTYWYLINSQESGSPLE